jgi:carbonic anhydrase
MGEIDALLSNNERYAAVYGHGHLSVPPARHVVLLTCMDARIDPAAALGLVPGDAHVLRNAGGLVTDDAERSLAISQHALGTREVMVVQHTNCGMQGLDEDLLAQQIAESTGVAPDPGVRFGGFQDLEVSVRTSVERLRSSPLLLHRDNIRGFVYDIQTGRLREVT